MYTFIVLCPFVELLLCWKPINSSILVWYYVVAVVDTAILYVAMQLILEEDDIVQQTCSFLLQMTMRVWMRTRVMIMSSNDDHMHRVV